MAGAVDHYRQFLVGSDARRIGALWQEMYRSQYFEGALLLLLLPLPPAAAAATLPPLTAAVQAAAC